MLPPKYVPSEFPDDVPLVDHVRALMWHFRIPAACLNSKVRGEKGQRGRYYRAAWRRLCYLLTLPSPNGHRYLEAEIIDFLSTTPTAYRQAVRDARTLHMGTLFNNPTSTRTRFPLTARIELKHLPL